MNRRTNMSDIRTTIRLLLMGLLFTPWLGAQSIDLPFAGFEPALPAVSGMRICFYNVENLFDTEDDTPNGMRNSSPKARRNGTTTSIGTSRKRSLKHFWRSVMPIRLRSTGCGEVENRRVLNDLVRQTS